VNYMQLRSIAMEMMTLLHGVNFPYAIKLNFRRVFGRIYVFLPVFCEHKNWYQDRFGTKVLPIHEQSHTLTREIFAQRQLGVA